MPTGILKIKHIILILLLCSFLGSCSSITNGRYIVLDKNYEVNELAKLLEIESWRLKEFNKGISLKRGNKIFIPYESAIIPTSLNGRSLASIDFHAMKSSSRFLWPVPSSKRVSSHYGRRWGRRHEGMDIPARKGSYIVASDDGVVVYSGKGLSGYGNTTVIAHADGFFTVYAHAHRNYTKKGQSVHRGQVIATVGSTGRSTGDHLHFEIRRNSKSFNPNRFLSRKRR